MKDKSRELIDYISQVIFDKKGFNILALDVRGISSLIDYLIIAEGHVDRHVQAICNEIVIKLKKKKKRIPLHVEGIQEGDWVVIDYGDIAVHLFMPGMREKYQLEKLWKDGKIIDIKLDIDQVN